ncbi:glycosyltransferase family 1 protein [soil metagenome]
MRIGIDARLWSETGVGRYIRNLVKELMILDQKNEYVLFVLSKDLGQIMNDPSTSLKGKKGWKIISADIHWHSVKEQLIFPQILNKENLDLMHFPYFAVPIFYLRPFVITLHDLIPYHFPTGKASTLPEPLYEFKNQMYRIVLHASVARARQILVPLKVTKKDVVDTLKISEEKVRVTYEGVDNELLHHSVVSPAIKEFAQNTTYFLYVGNGYPHKNVERMLNAFIQFKEKEKENVTLVLVGKEDYFYKKLKKQLKGVKSLHFFHTVNDQDLSYLYSHALSLIAPSLLEGFGLTTLEAMANNCLVLASDIPAFREVCQEAAIYFQPMDEGSLRKKMEEVYNLSLSEKEKHISLGKKRLSLFSWKDMAAQTLDIYESSISIRQGK